EVLVHHADARRHCVAGPREVLHGTVEEDLALVGFVETVEHIHERGLARPVLSEEAVDLPCLDDEIDVIVGDECAEALGDPSQLKLHVFSRSWAEEAAGRPPRRCGATCGCLATWARTPRS